MNGFDMNVAKNIVTNSNWIDKSVHFCRKGIYKLTKIKSKNQILKDRITDSIMKDKKSDTHNKVSLYFQLKSKIFSKKLIKVLLDK
jgi:hypothetical protein